MPDAATAYLLRALRVCWLVPLFALMPSNLAAQSATICDEVLADLPERMPDRIEAGRPCVEVLPDLPVEQQARIIREYARTLPGYIDQSQLESLIAQLDPSVTLPLEAYAARFYSMLPDEATATRLDDLVSRAAQADDELAQAHVEFAWANRIFRRGGEHGEMERHLRIALELARKNEMVGLLPYIHNALAVRAKVDGEYVAAIEEYRRALAAFEDNGDQASTGIVYSNIANIFSDLGDNQQAIRIYERAIAKYEEFEPEISERLVATKLNRASALANQKEFELAVEAFEQARRDNSSLESTRLTGLLNFQNAMALHGLGDTSEAIEMAKRSVTQILENRDPSEAASALNWLAARYLERGQLTDAQDALKRAREIMEPESEGVAGLLDNPGNTYWAQEYAQSMGSLLAELGRPSEANEYFEAALLLSNDRFEKEKVEAVSNSGLLFELRDRDQRIDRMNDRARIAQLQLSQSRLQTTLGFALAIGIGLLAFALFRSFKLQQSLAASKDTFLAEIHHRTKNNLQLLTSLFNMDARQGISAEQAKQRQLEAASRARTMAILHDHIYSQAIDGEREVDVKGFVERLMALLTEVFGRDGLHLKSNIQSAELDIDRITPLGLLICELVTNAYKHAFDGDEGTIEVSLIDKGSDIELSVKDNGVGLPPGAEGGKSDGIGMTLIRDLTDQLDAISRVESDSSGTSWSYEISKKP